MKLVKKSTSLQRLSKVKSTSMKVGWTKESTARYPNKENVNTALVAKVHDLGLGHQTRKNFTKSAVKSLDSKVIRHVAIGLLRGQDKRDILGLEAKNKIRASIRDINLIDTGLLRQSAGYEKV